MFHCWERRWIDVDGVSHTLSATAAIIAGVSTVFGFSRFGLSMRMPVSYTFSRENEQTVLKVLLFFKNPYAVFAHILQHYHDFQSNVAIQPYSFDGRIQLIICQIGHEFSVTIPEISTGWKKTLDGGSYTYISLLVSFFFFFFGFDIEFFFCVCVLSCLGFDCLSSVSEHFSSVQFR